MARIMWMLILLVGCSSYAEVSIENVLLNNSYNTSYEKIVPEVTEEKSLVIVNTTNTTNMTASVNGLLKESAKRKIEIELIGVNFKENKCGIKVNNETKWIDEDGKDVVSGVRILVFDAFLLHAEPDKGVCKIMIWGNVFSLVSK